MAYSKRAGKEKMDSFKVREPSLNLSLSFPPSSLSFYQLEREISNDALALPRQSPIVGCMNPPVIPNQTVGGNADEGREGKRFCSTHCERMFHSSQAHGGHQNAQRRERMEETNAFGMTAPRHSLLPNYHSCKFGLSNQSSTTITSFISSTVNHCNQQYFSAPTAGVKRAYSENVSNEVIKTIDFFEGTSTKKSSDFNLNEDNSSKEVVNTSDFLKVTSLMKSSPTKFDLNEGGASSSAEDQENIDLHLHL